MNKLIITLIFLGINFLLANNIYKENNSTNNKNQIIKINKKKKVALIIINKKLFNNTSNIDGKVIKYFNTKKDAIKAKENIIKNIHYLYLNMSLFVTFIFMIFQTSKIYKLQEEENKLLNNNSLFKKEEKIYNINKQIKFEVLFGLIIVFFINFIYYILELKSIKNLLFIIKIN